MLISILSNCHTMRYQALCNFFIIFCPTYSNFFFFNDTATTEIYTLSLHDALPISQGRRAHALAAGDRADRVARGAGHRGSVPAGREQLHREAGRLRGVLAGGVGAGAVLGVAERAAALMAAPLRILPAEDVPDDAALMEQELRRAGLAITTRRVESEAAFRQALQQFVPDVILTDHSMPQFTAADALRIAQEARSEAPVIIVTGSLDEETAVEYLKAGAADYIVKHHLERLPSAVARPLDLTRARTEHAP